LERKLIEFDFKHMCLKFIVPLFKKKKYLKFLNFLNYIQEVLLEFETDIKEVFIIFYKLNTIWLEKSYGNKISKNYANNLNKF
jgi:hypothetical protein